MKATVTYRVSLVRRPTNKREAKLLFNHTVSYFQYVSGMPKGKVKGDAVSECDFGPAEVEICIVDEEGSELISFSY